MCMTQYDQYSNPVRVMFPGSFDPLTYGHMDIIDKTINIFGSLLVGVGHSPNKQYLFSQQERIEILTEIYKDNPNVIIKGYEGLTAKFAKDNNIKCLIRGLRTEADFAYELKMAHMNKYLAKDIENIFILSSSKYIHISASLVKEVAMNGGDFYSLVPDFVVKRILEKLKLGYNI